MRMDRDGNNMVASGLWALNIKHIISNFADLKVNRFSDQFLFSFFSFLIIYSYYNGNEIIVE